MVTTRDLDWLAGFLEGEGSFMSAGAKHYTGIRIMVWSTDSDVIYRAAAILGVSVKGPAIRGKAKPILYLTVYKTAPEWMMTLYPLMGRRRKDQIRKCLDRWKGKQARLVLSV